MPSGQWPAPFKGALAANANKRVPCSKEMNRNLRTVYATVRERFQETSEESAVRGLSRLPLSLGRSRFRHTGKSGERAQGAVSGVGDPKERHHLLRLRALGDERGFRFANLVWRAIDGQAHRAPPRKQHGELYVHTHDIWQVNLTAFRRIGRDITY